MYIVSRTFDVEQAYVETLCQKWATNHRVIDGLLRKEVLRDARKDRAVQKVTILFYWQTKEHHKNWQSHPDHIAGHSKGKMRPEWIKNTTVQLYELVSE